MEFGIWKPAETKNFAGSKWEAHCEAAEELFEIRSANGRMTMGEIDMVCIL